MEKSSRTSQRIISAEILKAAGAEENRLIVSGGRLLRKSPSREIIHFGDITAKRHRHNQRFYIKTEEGYLIRDIGVHDGSQEKVEEEEPEPESRAIKLYYYKDKLYCRTKDGVLAEDKNILQEILG